MIDSIKWNNALKLSLSDVDETIADVYTPAESEMVAELSSFLSDGHKLFMVTGGSLGRVTSGITDFINPHLRHNILVSHCSGAEVWGFNEDGKLRNKPFYSIYEEAFSPELKKLWRDKTQELLSEFGLRSHPVEPKIEFRKKFNHPLDIMFDDRGPQITLEVVNGVEMTQEQVAELEHDVPETYGSLDLRIPILERAEQVFEQAGVPITPRLGGNFALDLAIKGVSKTTSIERVLHDPDVLSTIGLTADDINGIRTLEVWGDKFSTIRGGTDRHMSEAVSPQVRSIDFREENPAEFQKGYNIVVWDGKYHLHRGLLEYLQSRHQVL